MNCPFHMLIFKSRLRSYRDLPLRFAELGTVYRYEPSGTLRGLLRVRGFTQDDAHLFCRPDQMRSEEHTSELQSRQYLVCRLLLEKKPRPGRCAPAPRL